MARQPRGTTVRVTHDPDPARKKSWGVFWNQYRPGFAEKPTRRSEWCATQAEAEAFAAELRVALLNGDGEKTPAPVPYYCAADSLAALAGYDYAHPKTPTLTGWLEWVKRMRTAGTYKNYSDSLKNYIAPPPGHPRYPGLGNLVISNESCHAKVFADWLEAQYQEGVSLGMRKRLRSALGAFCRWAHFAGKLTNVNVCEQLGTQLRHRDEQDAVPEPNPFTGDEVTRIFDELEASEDVCWQVYFRFLLHTGVRVGEAAALKWTAIDWEKRTALIELNYSPAAGEDGPTKTHERRTLQLSTRVYDDLLTWKPLQARRAFSRFGQKAPVYVFTTMRGKRCLQDSTMRDVFARVMRACRITVGTDTPADHTPHNFRDTFATSHLLGQWDRKIGWTSRQLGHRSQRTTEKFYFKYKDTSATASFADEIEAWK